MELTAKSDEYMAHMMDESDVMSYSCGCVGYGYVPVQMLGSTYNADEAIMNGTVFPELALTIEEYGNICKKRGGVTDGK